MRLSRQKYWSGLPFPSPGDLPNPGVEPESPVSSSGKLFTTEPLGKPKSVNWTLTLNEGRTMYLSKGLGNKSAKFSIVIEKLSKWNINQLWGIQGFPGSSDGKVSPCNAGDLGSTPDSYPWVRKIPWRRKWQPTPVFLPGEFPGQRRLAGYIQWDHKKLDATNCIHTHTHTHTHTHRKFKTHIWPKFTVNDITGIPHVSIWGIICLM